jgi:hypothetical protein
MRRALSPILALALPCLLGGAARADEPAVFSASVNGPTLRVWGAGLVSRRCNPALGGNQKLSLFLGTNQLQVVAATSNTSSVPPDYVQGLLPGGAAQLPAGDYALVIQCGSGTPDLDELSLTVFVDYAEQDIAKEMSRAETAESSLAASVTAEAQRAQQAEASITTTVTNNTTTIVNTIVTAETNRALFAEASLQSSLTETNGSLTGLRSQLDQTNGAVAGLQGALSQANGTVTAQQQQLNSLAAQVQALQAVKSSIYVGRSSSAIPIQIEGVPAASCVDADPNRLGSCAIYQGTEITQVAVPAGTYLLTAVIPVLNFEPAAQYGECALNTGAGSDAFRPFSSFGSSTDARQVLSALNGGMDRTQMTLTDVVTFTHAQTVILSCAGAGWEILSAVLVALPVSG